MPHIEGKREHYTYTRTMLSSNSKDETTPPPPLADLVYELPMIDPCYALMWVPEIDMIAVGARILHTYFQDEQGWEILTYVPTQKFFKLHKEPVMRRLFKTENMDGYSHLRPWGPDLRRAWELVHSIEKTGSIGQSSLILMEIKSR